MSAYGTVRGAVLEPGDGGYDAERTGKARYDPANLFRLNHTIAPAR